jgi:hypothetical protein
MGDKYKILVWKLKERSALEDASIRRDYNIKINLKDAGWKIVNGINPAHIKDKCTVMNTVMNRCVP